MSETPLLDLPLLEAAQAQKHITLNEALLRLDGLVHLSVASRNISTPPDAREGARYIIGAGAAGAWLGQAGNLALAQGGGWVFLPPRSGWRAWVEDERRFLLFDGAGWLDLLATEQPANLNRLGINAAADDVNRLAVASPAVLFTHAGGDQQVKLNKNAAPNTASLLYQTGWSGRAEMGLAGDDDFRVKVSADGAAWRDAILIDRTTGAVSLPNTPAPQQGARVLYNQSLATQGPGFATESYLAGSAIALPAAGLRAGTRYSLTFDAAKTAAGVAPAVLTLRLGKGGAISDAALASFSFPAQTALADDGRFTLEATFRSVGGTAVLHGVGALCHGLATGGLAGASAPVRRATSVPFNSALAGAMLGVSLKAGAAAAWTVSLVQARLENAG